MKDKTTEIILEHIDEIINAIVDDDNFYLPVKRRLMYRCALLKLFSDISLMNGVCNAINDVDNPNGYTVKITRG